MTYPFYPNKLKQMIYLLFATRAVRLFAYGFLSVTLALYLTELGLSEPEIGLLLSLTLVGDIFLSLWLTMVADRFGRRRVLLVGAGLMVIAGVVFALTNQFFVLLVAAIVGVISPSGHEIGPFLSVEQASLSQCVPAQQRTKIFAWYNLIGSFATALGALISGVVIQSLQTKGFLPLDAYRVVVMGYALLGAVLIALFWALPAKIEADHPTQLATLAQQKGDWVGLSSHTQRMVFKLSGLFALDAFAGGFVVQSMVAYWFHLKFGAEAGTLGVIFFGSNLLAGISALLAARIAAKIGLIRTMVFTHLPSNLLLMLVPLMPTLPLAIALLLIRFSISQMDVPTRQAYMMAIVQPHERSAASGITNIARSVGAMIAPAMTGQLFANANWIALPFFLAGGLKIVYDLLLYRSFKQSDLLG